VNLTSAAIITRACLPGMIEAGWGRVVMISSVTGPRVAIPGEASEVGGVGVTVNAVLPGWIATEASSVAELAAAHATPLKRARWRLQLPSLPLAQRATSTAPVLSR